MIPARARRVKEPFISYGNLEPDFWSTGETAARAGIFGKFARPCLGRLPEHRIRIGQFNFHPRDLLRLLSLRLKW